MSTHNLCFEQKYEKYQSFLCENFQFWKVKFSIYFYRRVFVMYNRVLQKVLSLGSDYFSATFYLTYFYYKLSKYSPFTETHFCNLCTQSQKADK